MTAVDLAYEVYGADHLPTVLLTGSLGSTTQMFQPQLAALSARFRLVAVDTRGHGGSPVPPPPYDVVLCTSARLTPAGARLAVLDEAAHLGNLDQPDAVNALLLDHLTGEIAREGA